VEDEQQIEGECQWKNQEQQVRRVPEPRERIGGKGLSAEDQRSPQRNLPPGRQGVADEEGIGPMSNGQVRVEAVGTVEEAVWLKPQPPEESRCQSQQQPESPPAGSAVSPASYTAHLSCLVSHISATSTSRQNGKFGIPGDSIHTYLTITNTIELIDQVSVAIQKRLHFSS
jgi:hypothetical protein